MYMWPECVRKHRHQQQQQAVKDGDYLLKFMTLKPPHNFEPVSLSRLLRQLIQSITEILIILDLMTRELILLMSP